MRVTVVVAAGEPDLVQLLPHPALDLTALGQPVDASGSPMICPTRLRGFSEV